MSKTFGSAGREVATYSAGLWQDNGSFPGVERSLGVDARDVRHIFGEGTPGGSIRKFKAGMSGNGDMMGRLEEPSATDVLVELELVHDEAINATIDAMTVSRIL